MTQKNQDICQWIECYAEPLLHRATSMVADRHDAMDIVQEVFAAAVTSYDSFKKKSSPLTWLQRILNNKVADFYRERYRKPQTVSMTDFFDSAGSWTDNSVLNEWGRNADESEEQKELMDNLDKCLDRLPAKWQVTVRLYYIEEKKADEVCRQLGIAVANLWKILQRSRMQLRKCIELSLFE